MRGKKLGWYDGDGELHYYYLDGDERPTVEEMRLIEEAERLWKTIDPVLKKQAAKRAIEQIEKDLREEAKND